MWSDKLEVFMKSYINVIEFVSHPDTLDMTPVVFTALQKCRQVENPVLTFPKGTYHFWPEKAFEQFYFISNNDQGLKRIAFPLQGLQNMVIDGNDSEFIFHGRILPFVVERACNVTIRNIKIDYEHPFYSQGEIMDAGYEFIDLRISKEEYPYRIERESIVFYRDTWESTAVFSLLEIDPKTCAPAYKMGDEWIHNPGDITVEERGEEIVRFKGSFTKLHGKGNLMVISHEKRLNPGFFITGSSEVTLENIHIYHAGSMGVIGQLSHNITLDGVKVLPRPGAGRLISAISDGAHFVNCTGAVRVENCIFENQKDDPLNVHGIYTLISRIYAPDTIEVEFIHYQQFGINIYAVGDRIAFVNRKSLLSYYSAEVKEVIPVNQKYIRLVLTETIPDEAAAGDAIENPGRMPDLVVRNCCAGKNRARGFLITTPGKVLIEENTLYSAGAGILITGDCNFWFESGPVKDVTIRKNRFVDCCYGPWGRAVIDINPKVGEAQVSEEHYHRNILVENNHIQAFDPAILAALSVEGLKFVNNTIQQTFTYEPYKGAEFLLDVKKCKEVTIAGNTMIGFEGMKLVSGERECEC